MNYSFLTLLFMIVTVFNVAQANDTLPEVLLDLIAKGNKIEKLPMKHGLEAYLMIRGQNKQPIYLTPDKQAFVAGLLFNKEGMVTDEQLNSSSEKIISNNKKASVFDKLNRATAFTLGEGGPEIYVFSDPNCFYCHKFWAEASLYLYKNPLTINIIPIDIIRPKNELASKILSSDNPRQTFIRHEAAALKNKNTLFSNKATLTSSEKIISNNKLFFSFGFDKTPSFVYTMPDGELYTISGIPRDFLSLVSQLRVR